MLVLSRRKSAFVAIKPGLMSSVRASRLKESSLDCRMLRFGVGGCVGPTYRTYPVGTHMVSI
jgi:hypothetical protein